MLKCLRPLRPLSLALSLAALGCHAQNPAPSGSGPEAIQTGVKLSPEMARRIEVLIRSRSQLPLDADIQVGVPGKSDFTGYDLVDVSFTVKGNTSHSLPFLISTDGKTLAQINKFDLSQDPRQKASPVGRPARGGPENAPVLIVGFDDLECPYCAKMHAQLFPSLIKRYGDQVRIVYRDFPLTEIHPWAMHAAIDANCVAGGSGAGYWNFVDYVHAHAEEIPGTEKTAAKANQNLDKLAIEEGARQKLDAGTVAACIAKQDDSRIQASIKDGVSDTLRVDSTPVLFVNGEKVEGVVPIEQIYHVIDSALIAAGQTPPPPVPSPEPAPAAAKPGN